MSMWLVISAALTAGLVGAIAQFEGRSVVLWTAGGIAATAAAVALGTNSITTPLFVLGPAYALLLWMRSRDDRRNRDRAGGGVVR